MTSCITVDCPSCGSTSELAPSGLHLTIFDAGDGHFYEFFCPRCFELVRKPAPEDVQCLLTQVGVDHTFEHVPLEVLEHGEGPVLTVDDLMDFRVALRQHAHRLAQVAAPQPTP